VIKEPDISRVIKEDILRILGERKEKVKLNSIKTRMSFVRSSMLEAIKRLEEEALICVEDGFVRLTKKGFDEAKGIIKKHLVLEDYFEKTRSKIEAHTAAHILEHYISEAVVNNIRKLSTLKREGVPLTIFEHNKEGVITDITISDYGLFERIVSMGMFVGETIIITNEIPHGFIVKIRNKKFAIDKNIANGIKAVEYEKP
jgi:Mn-dependent DtxR family transcriptional regulator